MEQLRIGVRILGSRRIDSELVAAFEGRIVPSGVAEGDHADLFAPESVCASGAVTQREKAAPFLGSRLFVVRVSATWEYQTWDERSLCLEADGFKAIERIYLWQTSLMAMQDLPQGLPFRGCLGPGG